MEDFRQKLMETRCRNEYQNHYFYPHQAVHDLVTSESVHEILRDNKLKPYTIDSAVQYLIKTGGRRIFAILALIQRPHLFSAFIENDQLQRGDPDYKLPLKKGELKDLLPSPTLEVFGISSGN